MDNNQQFTVYRGEDNNSSAPNSVAYQKNTFATISLVFGLFGLIPIVGLWGTVLAIGFGRRALWKIRDNPQMSGKKKAIAGITLGVLEFLVLFGLVAAAAITTVSQK